ncbi:hypothetical protein [Acinetobacter sp. SA01]|nr:hypothetical protein [Acinetobacter sp. SA01]
MLKVSACLTLQELEYMQQLQLMYLLAYRDVITSWIASLFNVGVA